MHRTFESIYGVDFSGAKEAGRNLWVARLQRRGRSRRLELTELTNVARACGTAARAPALAYLVERVAASEDALWAMDFPFGLPIEVVEEGAAWAAQLAFLRQWGEDAYGVGVECLRRARAGGGPNHIRRTTDHEAKAPFDCYHYRIIYQTFYGMRDVLGPLSTRRGTAILPFQYRRLASARRVVVEACPSSTLKRLGLLHHSYKQPQGGPLTARRRRNRRALVDALARQVQMGERDGRVMMRNPGGDALDAVIAAVGAAHAWEATDHREVARHARYPREGRLYV